MNRKTKRAMKKNMGSEATEKLANQMALFGKLPEACLVCSKEFDKKDSDMIRTWNVVVKQDVVRLFCPECISKTQEALNVGN
tara:strand:+ start:186 stop:431 length:246 start_codon:yes stop_codon:yes gene_type:complete